MNLGISDRVSQPPRARKRRSQTLYPALTRSYPLLPALTCSHPLSSALTRSHLLSPALTRSHPFSPALTHSHHFILGAGEKVWTETRKTTGLVKFNVIL